MLKLPRETLIQEETCCGVATAGRKTSKSEDTHDVWKKQLSGWLYQSPKSTTGWTPVQKTHWCFGVLKLPRPTSSKPPFPPRQTMQTGLAHPQRRAFQEGWRYVVRFCCPSTGPLFKGLSWASPTEATPFWFKPAGRWASPETALLDVLLIFVFLGSCHTWELFQSLRWCRLRIF